MDDRTRAAAGRAGRPKARAARHVKGGRRVRARTLGAVGALALQVLLVLAMLFAVTLDRAHYSSEYARLGVYESCGADAETLERATNMLLEYLRGGADGLSGRGVIDGEERDIFGEDEIAHMADVKRLYETALIVMLCAGAAAIACLLLAGRDRRRAAQGALIGLAAFAALLAAAGIWCASDFDAAFNAFHGLLFNNELWLMNPDTQFMIRMFPAELFSGMGLRIAAYSAMGMAAQLAIYCILGFYGRKARK